LGDEGRLAKLGCTLTPAVKGWGVIAIVTAVRALKQEAARSRPKLARSAEILVPRVWATRRSRGARG